MMTNGSVLLQIYPHKTYSSSLFDCLSLYTSTYYLTYYIKDHGFDGGRRPVEVHPASVGASVRGLNVVQDQPAKRQAY